MNDDDNECGHTSTLKDIIQLTRNAMETLHKQNTRDESLAIKNKVMNELMHILMHLEILESKSDNIHSASTRRDNIEKKIHRIKTAIKEAPKR